MDTQIGKLSAALADVTKARAFRYGAKDDRGVTLDCLKIVDAGGGTYLGVAHALKDDVFRLSLVRSADLTEWKFVTALDDYASQGELARGPDGSYWLAYERDDRPYGNRIRLRRYADAKALEANRPAYEATLGRTLAPTAEGTPSFERIGRGEVALRLHYYRNADVDRAASGVLRGAGEWKAAPDDAVNRAIEAHGVRGNIGSRSRFTYRGATYYAQEGQLVNQDWASWRVFLMDGGGGSPRRAVPFPLRTHRGARSFANPSVTVLDAARGLFFVSLFLPSQGNPAEERGELIYTVEIG